MAATDYLKALPLSVARWIPGPYTVLGTDGFGRSDGRAELRSFFENDARHLALAALYVLAEEDRIDRKTVDEAVGRLDIDPDKPDPRTR